LEPLFEGDPNFASAVNYRFPADANADEWLEVPFTETPGQFVQCAGDETF